MAKLYKAVDKMDVGDGYKCWLVNEKGVAVSSWLRDDEKEVNVNKSAENLFGYEPIERFKENAINPVLIAEW